MSAGLASCAGFLLAVLWFDRGFDVQVRGRGGGALPEEVLASIAAYYRRVTTQARPMNLLVAFVMLVTVSGTISQLVRGTGSRPLHLLALVLCGVPIVGAGARTVPSAVRLGSRADPPEEQSRLARSICRDHLVFFPTIAAFGIIELLAT